MEETELLETNKLFGYCEACKEWTFFEKEDRPKGCQYCHGPFSSRNGFQITTKRSFNPNRKVKKIKGAK